MQVTPDKIMQIGMGFMASKTLLAAINLDLFTFLGEGTKSSKEIYNKLNLATSHGYDFLDALVSLGFLNREGLKENATYSNSAETSTFLDKSKMTYIGDILKMANSRLYSFWGNLEEGLQTGKPQNEIKTTGKQIFEELYSDEVRLREFVNAMTSVQVGNFMALGKKFDFSKYNTLADIGGCAGMLSAQVAAANPHMKCTTYDLPPVAPIAKETISKMNLQNQVEVSTIDFFKDDFPKVDVITMGNILHDWNLENKMTLIKKAYRALPDGGAFIAIENIIDPDRKENTFGLLMSLNMLIELGDGFDYSETDFTSWCKEVGFKEIKFIPLTGPTKAGIAIK